MPLSSDDQYRRDRLAALTQRIRRDNPPTPPLFGEGSTPSISDPPGPPGADRAAQGILASSPAAILTENRARQSGGTRVDNLPMGVEAGQRVVAQPSTLVGGRIQDGMPQPTYRTGYDVFGADGRQGEMSITGPDQRAGGGTLSAPDQGNGGTVEGNVEAINRQIEALRSLREARNPGVTEGTAARAFGDQVSFGTPGGWFSEVNAPRAPSLADLPSGQPGDARRRRDLLSLMELQQRDRQFNAQQALTQAQQAAQQQMGLLQGAQEAQQAAANRKWEQAKWGQQYGLDQQRLALDQQQGGIIVFDAPTGAKDVLGNPLTAKTLFDTRRREVIQPGAGIAGDGAALQPPPQDIEYLKANPQMAERFDAKYGKGAASQVLGK